MAEPDKATIWRYMNLAGFVTMLSRGVFFTQPQYFSDPWEGSYSVGFLQRFREQNSALSGQALQAAWNAIYSAKTKEINCFGVSCWHESEDESAALWSLYMPQGLGVAIKSSIERIASAVSFSGREWHTCRVKYQDEPLGETAVDLLTYKRPAFSFEREVRFLAKIRQDELNAIACYAANMGRQERHVSTWPPMPVISGTAGYASFDETIDARATPAGIHLETKNEELITGIFLAPGVSYQIRRAVIDVAEAFKLPHGLIRESSLDVVPPDIIRFFDNQKTVMPDGSVVSMYRRVEDGH